MSSKAKPAVSKPVNRDLDAQGQGRAGAARWYWFCDEGGIKWVPYQEQHQRVIQEAWQSNRDNVIIVERFKINFERGAHGVAAGQQFNYQIHISWRRDVIRGAPDSKGMINDVPCEANPR